MMFDNDDDGDDKSAKIVDHDDWLIYSISTKCVHRVKSTRRRLTMIMLNTKMMMMVMAKIAMMTSARSFPSQQRFLTWCTLPSSNSVTRRRRRWSCKKAVN